MKKYEIILTYHNGCSGSTHPLTSFEEVMLDTPADHIRARHSKNFQKFELVSSVPGKEIWKYDNGCVSYIYEFTEL